MKSCSKYIFVLFILFYQLGQITAQIEDYEYRTPILQATQGWNRIQLNSSIFSEIEKNLSDVRIYGKNQNGEFIEVPFIIDIQEHKVEKKEIPFNTLNQTQTNGYCSYTFELSNKEIVNKINLHFANQNFDWRLKVEGSMNQNSWSTIRENVRIVSIANLDNNYKYTQINIPDSKFNFYRISFESSIIPKFLNASLSKEVVSNFKYQTYQIVNIKTQEFTKAKSTKIEIDLESKFPISQMIIKPTNTNDYYRPFSIEAITDSFKTETGWHYRYQNMHQGRLHSFDDNTFNFNKKIVKKISLTIRNQDNQPLDIGEIIVRGPKYYLIAQVDKTDDLYLAYSCKNATSPKYDLAYFKDKIPKSMNMATLGMPKHYPKETSIERPLFKNKWWLWGMMIIIILLLGKFSFNMLRDN